MVFLNAEDLPKNAEKTVKSFTKNLRMNSIGNTSEIKQGQK